MIAPRITSCNQKEINKVDWNKGEEEKKWKLIWHKLKINKEGNNPCSSGLSVKRRSYDFSSSLMPGRMLREK